MASNSRGDRSPGESRSGQNPLPCFEEKSADNETPQCAICLGKIKCKSFANTCLHKFCFECLLKWSQKKTECPLCNGPFSAIIHIVKSNGHQEYEEQEQDATSTETILLETRNTSNSDIFSNSKLETSTSDSEMSESEMIINQWSGHLDRCDKILADNADFQRRIQKIGCQIQMLKSKMHGIKITEEEIFRVTHAAPTPNAQSFPMSGGVPEMADKNILFSEESEEIVILETPSKPVPQLILLSDSDD